MEENSLLILSGFSSAAPISDSPFEDPRYHGGSGQPKRHCAMSGADGDERGSRIDLNKDSSSRRPKTIRIQGKKSSRKGEMRNQLLADHEHRHPQSDGHGHSR